MVIERESTRSKLTNGLPELELPGQRGLKEDDCGDEIPTHACEECGHPFYAGRCCASPVCERCWAAAVKEKAIRYAGKLEGLRRKLYANNKGDFDFQHVVASLKDFRVDSEEPYERALLILKILLEEYWDVDGFASIYHPYRIKREFRKEGYEHDGLPGEGDMTWKDVMSKDDPMAYLTFEPHFHLFFPMKRAGFDYMAAEGVHNQSGWLFHRVTKSGDSNVSVSDLEDLVRQITYSFAHAGVNEWNADRAELTSRMKGDLHNCYVPDDAKQDVTNIFTEVAPLLLGVPFVNAEELSCDAEVSAGTDDDSRGVVIQRKSEEPNASQGTAAGTGDSASNSKLEAVISSESPIRDDRVACYGDMVPIHEAAAFLTDSTWCSNAPYVAKLREAVRELRSEKGEVEMDPDRNESDMEYPELIQTV